MANLLSLIKKTDIFGQGIQLKIHNQNKSKTLFGGILTVLMLILCLSMFYFSAQDLMYHKNPQINVEKQVLTKYPNITLNNNAMPISLFVSGESNVALPVERYLKISAKYVYGSTVDTLSEKEYNLTICTNDYFSPLIDDNTFDELLMNNHSCVENLNATLSGSWGESYISYLMLILEKCENKTETDKCAPINEIEKFLNSKDNYYLNIFFANTVINPQNNTVPITHYIYGFYKSALFNTKKIHNFFIRDEVLESDDDFIFENKLVNNTISIDSSFGDENLMTDNTLIEIYIYSSNRKIIYHRKYMKIQQVLANVGGISNVLNITFIICSYMFSIVKRDEIILNKIFEFDFTENSNVEKLHQQELKKQIIIDINRKECNMDLPPNQNSINTYSKAHSIENGTTMNNCISNFQNKKGRVFSKLHKNLNLNELISNRTNNSLNLNNSKNSTKNDQISFTTNTKHRDSLFKQNSIRNLVNKKEQFPLSGEDNNIIVIHNNPETFPMKTAKEIIDILNTKNKTYQLRFSFCDVVRAFLCCNFCMNPSLKKKKALYDNRKFVVDEYLDISYIIQKFEELEKLKIVLFDNKQLALFNFIAKELISLDEGKVGNHNLSQYKNFNKNREQLVNIIVNFREKMINDFHVRKIDKKLFSLLNPIFI